jgi:hypothetical protein
MIPSGRRPRRGIHLLEIAIVEWQLLGECDSGTTICTDSVTMHRKNDLRKMSVLIDIKIIQTKGGCLIFVDKGAQGAWLYRSAF